MPPETGGRFRFRGYLVAGGLGAVLGVAAVAWLMSRLMHAMTSREGGPGDF